MTWEVALLHAGPGGTAGIAIAQPWSHLRPVFQTGRRAILWATWEEVNFETRLACTVCNALPVFRHFEGTGPSSRHRGRAVSLTAHEVTSAGRCLLNEGTEALCFGWY